MIVPEGSLAIFALIFKDSPGRTVLPLIFIFLLAMTVIFRNAVNIRETFLSIAQKPIFTAFEQNFSENVRNK